MSPRSVVTVTAVKLSKAPVSSSPEIKLKTYSPHDLYSRRQIIDHM